MTRRMLRICRASILFTRRKFHSALESRVVESFLRVVWGFRCGDCFRPGGDCGGRGVTARLREALTPVASKKIVWVDSRVRSEHFRGVILKPNRDEARGGFAAGYWDGSISLRCGRIRRLGC